MRSYSLCLRFRTPISRCHIAFEPIRKTFLKRLFCYCNLTLKCHVRLSFPAAIKPMEALISQHRRSGEGAMHRPGVEARADTPLPALTEAIACASADFLR